MNVNVFHVVFVVVFVVFHSVLTAHNRVPTPHRKS